MVLLQGPRRSPRLVAMGGSESNPSSTGKVARSLSSTSSSQSKSKPSKPAKTQRKRASKKSATEKSSSDAPLASTQKQKATKDTDAAIEEAVSPSATSASLKRKAKADSDAKSVKQKRLAERVTEDISETKGNKLVATERKYWDKGLKYVVGVDEAGRGPLAGPVVVAACAIDESAPDIDSSLIDDSKTVDEHTRERVFEMLTKSKHVHYAVDIVTVDEIDTKNILRATLSGMDRVVEKLRNLGKCHVVLVDGPFAPPQAKNDFGPSNLIEAIKGGDGKVRSIAAASILAKVTRDRLMREYHVQFPAYGFDKHKGYPVPAHVAALNKHGPCSIHRKSFSPVQRALQLLKTTKA